MKQTIHDIKCGVKNKIPWCCVIWFVTFWRIKIIRKYIQRNYKVKIFENGRHCHIFDDTSVNYVQCPMCVNKKIKKNIKIGKCCNECVCYG